MSHIQISSAMLWGLASFADAVRAYTRLRRGTVIG
jgi:hypothetical protein